MAFLIDNSTKTKNQQNRTPHPFLYPMLFCLAHQKQAYNIRIDDYINECIKLQFTVKNIFTAFVLLLFPSMIIAQASQVVYGIITDNVSSKPISNVSIELLNYVPLKVAKTDDQGRFTLEDVPLGKHRLLVMHDNYEVLIVPEVEVTSGKQVELNIGLEEVVVKIDEIVVQTKAQKTTKDQPNNGMALVGIRSFTIDDVRRYSGARNDPSRLAANFAGVHIGNDYENGIIVRGNSPLNVLWQLEGIPIPNPNHFTLAGYINGLLPMINTNLMRNSDFLNGAFPAQYGNVTGGVFDIGLRSGNKNIYEGTAQFGYTGLEVGFEGPISQKTGSSFVLGYRYSIYDIFRVIGLNYGTTLVPNNQDLSFKVDLGETKIGRLSIFGIAGTGNITIAPGDVDSTDHANKFARDVSFKKEMAVLGLKHQVFLSKNKQSYWQTTLGGSIDSESYQEDTLNQEGNKTLVLDNRNWTWNATLSTYFNHTFNYTHTVRVGLIETYFHANSRFQDFLFNDTYRNFSGSTLLSQAYAQYLIRFNKKLKINVGVNAQHLLLNNTYGIGPRFSLSWRFLSSHKVSLGYGWHHQMQPLRLYFNQERDTNGNWVDANHNLGFTQAHHFVLAYDWAILDNWRLKLEGYYQLYTNIPITTYSSTYSGINMGQEFELLNLTQLENTGFARNYGAELTLEKFFSNRYYGLLTASYTDSKYQASDKVWRFTPYNNSFVINFLAGKVFKIGPKRANAITVDVNFVYATGSRYTPIDLEESKIRGYEIRQWDKAYSLQGKDYWRIDLKFGAQFNNEKNNISHRIFLDLINVTNHQNILVQQYNAATQTIETANQLGFFPDLTYRLTFGFKPKKNTAAM